MQEEILKTPARRFQVGIHFNLGYARKGKELLFKCVVVLALER